MKLKLDIDALTVESFATGADYGLRGTVDAHSAEDSYGCTEIKCDAEGVTDIKNSTLCTAWLQPTCYGSCGVAPSCAYTGCCLAGGGDTGACGGGSGDYACGGGDTSDFTCAATSA
jgi:hypothetical protein